MMSPLRLVNLGIAIDQRYLLQNLTLQFPLNAWIAIVGSNGVGKSTLLNTLAGLRLPTIGGAFLGHQSVHTMEPKVRAQHISWLGYTETPMSDSLVYDVVMFGRLPWQRWLAKPNQKDINVVRQVIQQAYIESLLEKTLGQLSAGELQRVLLARALAVDAPFLLQDEPLTHLDITYQQWWVKLVRDQLKKGKTVITVLHELNIALMADYLLILTNQDKISLGPTTDPQVHSALEKAFGNQIKVVHYGEEQKFRNIQFV